MFQRLFSVIKLFLFFRLGLIFLGGGARAAVFSLSDLQWTLKNQNGSIVIPGSVPSQVHLDLLRSGIITEPLLGINGKVISYTFELSAFILFASSDFTQRWVTNDEWTYTADLTPFTRGSLDVNGTRSRSKSLLVFYGIDTIANIVSRL